jgi:enamine deaminase RidA (YjgF/YER057c/UK114 family)
MAEDPQTQFHAVFSKLRAYLAEAGLGFDDIVEITSFISTCASITASLPP